MTHEMPEQSAPWWRRFVDAVRYVVSLEPVAVAAVWRAVVVLLTSVGVVISDATVTQGLAIIAAVYALVEVVQTIRTRARAVPTVAVVERVEDGRVIAGEANELETGTYVREIGAHPSS